MRSYKQEKWSGKFVNYICIDCRKKFSYGPCPDCGGDLYNYGWQRRVPKKRNIKAWRKIRKEVEESIAEIKKKEGWINGAAPRDVWHRLGDGFAAEQFLKDHPKK
tara:strand:- start:76 stop:390 length:315 start_codon:yes stop_codon:yes gene_type:complete